MMNTGHAMVRWGMVFALAVVLASPSAQAAVIKRKKAAPVAARQRVEGAAPAAAKRKKSASVSQRQRVVVLDLEGDSRGRVRAQLDAALRRTRQVSVVSLKQYAATAKKSGLRGAEASSEAALVKVAPRLKLDSAVGGAVGSSLHVRVLDADGQVLSEQEVMLTRGKLSAADAKKAALAIATAVRAPRTAPVLESPRDVAPAEPMKPAEPLTPAPPPAVVEAPVPVSPGAPVVAERPTEAPPAVAPPPDAPAVAERPAEAPPAVTPRPDAPKKPVIRPDAVAVAPSDTDSAELMPVDPESHTTTDPFLEVALDTGSGGTVGDEPVRPPLARLFLGGTTTWRKYCARPGVKSCSEFDRKAVDDQLGDRVDYSSSVPYLGVSAELELLPLARKQSAVRGLGAVLGYRRGYSSTNVTLVGDAGQSVTREVVATDSVLTAQALYRYYFGLGEARQLLGYAGLRAGLLTRAFDVDESAESPLTGTHRMFPAVGLEVSVPLLRSVRLEGAGQVFIDPKPGEGFDDEGGALGLEVSDYGTSVSSFGWEAELGVAGELWGPFGYSVRFRLSRYQDTFSGAGTRTGWEAGGVAEETYSSLHWGLTASY
ncbi:hypothetical protein [Pyxidicoccus caerfyrddinensis]|uniref:hypothetical protein n=1 Tax=Pyxidicoccus caerfyrddinensis TaxID=2709663 RepID=UPI001F07F994|nr:hypothetical protein [Pyxidicoccus caerfyrddinensis]